MDALTRIGQELGGPDWVQGPGGNVSVKEGDMLHVKASGKRLRDMGKPGSIATVPLADARAALEGDKEAEARTFARTPRPSLETYFHAIGAKVVIHTHAVGAMLVACSGAKRPSGVVEVPYERPGRGLGVRVAEALGGAREGTVLLASHGLVVYGETTEGAIARTREIDAAFRAEFANLEAFETRVTAPYEVLRADGLVMGAAFGGGRMAVVLTRDGNSEIYLGSPDGSNLRRLTNDPGADITPVWSPDGSKIAFVSDRSGGPQVYVMDAGGGGQRRVSFQGSYNTGPSWAPDSQTIAYAGRTGGASDIYTVNLAGGAARRLTEGQGNNTDPTYSPDGRLIAFSSSRGGIFLMNQDGLNQQRILPGVAEGLRWEPR